MNKPRKPFLAGLLTFFAIGLGHVYAGALKRGLGLYIVGQGVVSAVLIALIVVNPGKLSLILCILFGLGFFPVLHARCRAAGAP